MSNLTSIFVAGLLGFTATAAHAATLEYNFPIDTTQGGTANTEIRATFLEVLRPINLESLSAGLAFNQVRDISANWTIYNSNVDDEVLSAVTSVDFGFTLTGDRLEEEVISTNIGVALDPGYYLFALETVGSLFYTYYREPTLPAGSLPFTTDDGAFRVLNGGILNFSASDASIISGNQSLPAISAEYEIDTLEPVPLPAGGVLLLSALGAGIAVGRRKRRKT